MRCHWPLGVRAHSALHLIIHQRGRKLPADARPIFSPIVGALN